MSWKSGSLNLLEPSGPHRACNGTTLPGSRLRLRRGWINIKQFKNTLYCAPLLLVQFILCPLHVRPNSDPSVYIACKFCFANRLCFRIEIKDVGLSDYLVSFLTNKLIYKLCWSSKLNMHIPSWCGLVVKDCDARWQWSPKTLSRGESSVIMLIGTAASTLGDEDYLC
jgi:hypothetical protein